MPSDIEKFKQTEKNMANLARFLSGLDLPDDIVFLRKTLNNKLADLRGVLPELENPTVFSRSEREERANRIELRTYINRIINDFQTLLFEADRLCESLKAQPDTQALRDGLIAILTSIKEEQIRTLSSVDINPNAFTPAKSSENIRAPFGETAEEQKMGININTINDDQRNRLASHQSNLKKLVQWYTDLRKQFVQRNAALSKLTEGKHRDTKEDIASNEYWREVTDLIHRALMTKPASLKEFFDVDDLVLQFNEALKEALQSVKTVADSPMDASRRALENAIDQAVNHIEESNRLFDQIADKCKDGAMNELENIDSVIQEIFQKKSDDSGAERFVLGRDSPGTNLRKESDTRQPLSRVSNTVEKFG